MEQAQLLTIPTVHPELVNVRVFFGAGSSCDPDDKLGLAHMLEHILYAGLNDIIAEANQPYILESLQATTYRYGMSFEFDILKADQDLVEPLVHRLYQSLSISPEVLQRERQILLRELIDDEDQPTYQIDRELASWLYPDNKLSRPNGGTSQSVTHITAADVEMFHVKHVMSQPSLVAVSDNAKPPHGLTQFAEKAVANSFSDMITQSTGRLEQPQPFGDAMVSLYTAGPVATVHENLGLYLLIDHLNARLKSIFDSNGLAYDFGVGRTSFGLVSELYAYAVVSPDDLQEAERLLAETLGATTEIGAIDYKSLCEQSAKSLALEDMSPGELADKLAISAAVFGAAPAAVMAEVAKAAHYPRKDYVAVCKNLGLDKKAWRVSIRR